MKKFARSRLFALTLLLGLGVAVAERATVGHAQQQAEPRRLEHDDYDKWRRLGGTGLSHDGNVLAYTLSPPEGDSVLMIRRLDTGREYKVVQGSGVRLGYGGEYAFYSVRPSDEAMKAARKAKKKPEEMPKPKFEMLHLASGETYSIPRIKSFAIPEEGTGWVAVLLEKPLEESSAEKTAEGEAVKEETSEEGSAAEGGEQEASAAASAGDDKDGKEEKKKDPGTVLVLRNLESGVEMRFPNVVSYLFSKDGQRLAWSTSSDTPAEDGVHVLNFPNLVPQQVISGLGNYQSMTFDEAGRQLAFITDRDDYETKESRLAVYRWTAGSSSAQLAVNSETKGMREGWEVARSGLSFSENGQRMFLNTRPRPDSADKDEEEDSDEEDEDEVKVDIWHWQDPLLQPMQLVRASAEKNRSYRAMFEPGRRRFVQLADEQLQNVTVSDEGNGPVALGASNLPYQMQISWESPGFQDVYVINLQTGEREQLLEGIRSFPSLSPRGKYFSWWDPEKLSWHVMSTSTKKSVEATKGIPYPLQNELHDSPALPRGYGVAGWLENDAGMLVYDRHDIWLVDPEGKQPARCVTENHGRNHGLRFRYLSTDPEERFIKPEQALLLASFHLTEKTSGFYRDQVEGVEPPTQLYSADERISFSRKAEGGDRVLVTRQTFRDYPDLWETTLDFADMKRLTTANPQQAEYRWGTAELVEWSSLDGVELQGILYKPDDFDPDKKYPMMVYFYERNSDNLHRYVSPAPARASINYSFYVSRGYLVFVPDIPYRIGHPGQSCLNAVLPGVTELVGKGFVQEDKIGVQGHSWGGYQVAYLVTRSNVFAAAEAGAPVSNMTSAYGGIRWSSGMSRMFQYERTQSRIGDTLWQAQQKYIENSPLFQLDQVETPLLILHNDEDGAVPWYQGIELFVALRRLGKPAWMFNYNGEAHGLTRLHNQRDWSVRMQQFFDHYLMDQPAPQWLAEGVPAVEKGENLGLELIKEQESSGEE